MSQWQEIGGDSSEMWNREGSIEGLLVNRQSNVGPNNSMKYNLKTDKGDIGVWGSTVLDTKMELITNGSLVRITYLGQQTPKSGGKPYHDFKVEAKPPEFTEVTPEQVKNVQETMSGSSLSDTVI